MFCALYGNPALKKNLMLNKGLIISFQNLLMDWLMSMALQNTCLASSHNWFIFLESGNADGSEERQNGEDLPVQQSDGIAESLSTISDSSDNESLRSRVPRVNSPEHLVSV